VHPLFVDFKKAYDSARREFFYNFLFEFSIPLQLVRLIKMYLKGTSSRDQIGKILSDMFPIKNGLKYNAVSSLFLKFAVEYAMRRVQVIQDGLK
jgi:hypothetical protein